MALISDGVKNVRAFELPSGIWEQGGCVPAPRVALVRWHSSHDDKLHQVYVNGQFAGVTLDSQQRQMIVHIPSSFEAAVRIGVFAVEAEQAHIDFSGMIEPSIRQTGRVRISILREQNLPLGATVQIYSDQGTSQIDYDAPLNSSPISVWPAWQDKAGFGLSMFATSDFGYDAAGAIGCGKGSFGHGEFGVDVDIFEWISTPLEAGVFKFGVKIFDQAGNASSGAQTRQVTVTPAAKPAENLAISLFDRQSNQLVLTIK